MRVLVACEFSGTVRDAFTEAGHTAWSCDYLLSEKPGLHIVGNVLPMLDEQEDHPLTWSCQMKSGPALQLLRGS